MDIAIFGATGRVGSRLLQEALARGHRVTALSRDPARLPAHERLTAVQGELADEVGIARLIAGAQALLSTVHFTDFGAEALLRIARLARVPRVLVTGGAGSLYVAPGLQLVDSAEFPAAVRPEAEAGRRFLETLKTEREIDWTFLSPSMLIQPGERSGRFRLGGDELLRDAAGLSRISMEDFAVAMLDELEQPRHSRRRFTVGY